MYYILITIYYIHLCICKTDLGTDLVSHSVISFTVLQTAQIPVVYGERNTPWAEDLSLSGSTSYAILVDTIFHLSDIHSRQHSSVYAHHLYILNSCILLLSAVFISRVTLRTVALSEPIRWYSADRALVSSSYHWTAICRASWEPLIATISA